MPDGSDGGAFIEFLDAPSGSGNVPKYTAFINDVEAYWYSRYWFANYTNNFQNVRYLLSARAEAGYGTFGWAWGAKRIAIAFDGPIKQNDDQRENSVTHEIGHTFGLIGPPHGSWPHVDAHVDRRNHCDSNRCIMAYGRARNHLAEFSIDCLLTGSYNLSTGISNNWGDSLRDRADD
jgi:hypothetical protein